MPNETGAETRDRTGDFQIFGLTLSQLSYRGQYNLSHAAVSRRYAQCRLLFGLGHCEGNVIIFCFGSQSLLQSTQIVVTWLLGLV